MKLIKKTNKERTTPEVIEDMKYAYETLINQKRFPTNQNQTLSITITDLKCGHEKDLKFQLTNLLFNTIHKEYRMSLEHLNYFFVIEYSEVISKGNYIPTKWDIHTHIVVNTSIPQQTIEYYINNTFRKSDIYIENITQRDDKANYINYLTKQGLENNILSDDSYNYKICLF
jgi:hypothetical protein